MQGNSTVQNSSLESWYIIPFWKTQKKKQKQNKTKKKDSALNKNLNESSKVTQTTHAIRSQNDCVNKNIPVFSIHQATYMLRMILDLFSLESTSSRSRDSVTGVFQCNLLNLLEHLFWRILPGGNYHWGMIVWIFFFEVII